MTSQLQRAIEEAEKLPAADQDAIASRLLAEVDDEREWHSRFSATTEDQWDRLAAQVRREIKDGRTHPLDEVLSLDEPPL